MAITAKLYGNFHLNASKKLINDLSSAATTIKVALCTSTYTPSQDNHTSYNDITGEVAAGGGYSTGGATLATKTVTYAGTVVTFDADDVSWAASTITARYAVVYDATPAGATDKKLIGYIDFGGNMSTASATFQIVFNASGIFTVTVA